jgi:hypothetical protein
VLATLEQLEFDLDVMEAEDILDQIYTYEAVLSMELITATNQIIDALDEVIVYEALEEQITANEEAEVLYYLYEIEYVETVEEAIAYLDALYVY